MVKEDPGITVADDHSHAEEDTGATGDDSHGTEGTSWRWTNKEEGKWEWIDPAPPSIG